MLKSASQMHFQQLSQNLEKQLQILSERISRITSFQKMNMHLDTYSQLNTKIKNLNNVLNKIDIEMKIKIKDKNYNQYDLKEKLRKYTLAKNQIVTKYETIGRQIEQLKKRYLMERMQRDKGRKSQIARKDIEMQNISKANDLMSRYQGANDDLKETEQITTAWIPELHYQGQVIHEMKDDVRDVETQLGMVDQLMRIIKNRNLITKLLLIVMIVLMGIVDLMLLVLKLSR